MELQLSFPVEENVQDDLSDELSHEFLNSLVYVMLPVSPLHRFQSEREKQLMNDFTKQNAKFSKKSR